MDRSWEFTLLSLRSKFNGEQINKFLGLEVSKVPVCSPRHGYKPDLKLFPG